MGRTRGYAPPGADLYNALDTELTNHLRKEEEVFSRISWLPRRIARAAQRDLRHVSDQSAIPSAKWKPNTKVRARHWCRSAR